jgi:hypothetical protein
MSIYDPLRDKLNANKGQSLKLSFLEIEGLIGQPLPRSAYDRDAWWSNEDPTISMHSQNRAWKLAGYDAEPSRGDRTVTFRRGKSN